MQYQFEWNYKKDRENKRKYKIDFRRAATVFRDSYMITIFDYEHSDNEDRWITLGTSTKDKILVVANMFFDENGEEIIRIISARKANEKERIFYEQH